MSHTAESDATSRPADGLPRDAAGASRSALLVIFLTVFIDLLGFAIVIPLLPIYARQMIEEQGLGAHKGLIIGTLMASFSVMQLFFSPFWGRMSDRFGRRPILLFSLGGSTFFYFLFGLAMLSGNLVLLYITRIGAGIAAATLPTAQAYIADVTPPEKRARGMALIGAAFGLGFTCGPLIGAIALLKAGPHSHALPGFVAAGLSACALTLAIFKLRETLAPNRVQETRHHLDFAALRTALATPSIPLLLLTGFLSVLALANLESTLSLTIDSILGQARPALAQNLSASEEHGMQILLLFIYIGVVQSIVQGVIVRRVAKRVPEKRLALFGGVVAVLGFLFLAAVTRPETGSLVWMMAAVAVEITGLGFVLPAIQSLVSRRSNPATQGGILGVSESVSTLARIVGQFSAYQLFFWRQTSQFWVAAVVMAAATLIALAAAGRGHDWTAAGETGGQ